MLEEFFLYNSESATCTYISSPFWSSLQNRHLTHVGHHRTLGWAACAMQQHPTSYPFYTWECIYVSAILSIHPTLSFPSQCPQVHLLCLHLYCYPANRFIRPFFWISYTHTHTHTYTHTRMYVLIYSGICFSLSDLPHSVWQTLGPSTLLQMTHFIPFSGWLYHCRWWLQPWN